ncbi:hypothetical protein K491DRAFT_761961 [Lophiostoma macrostomum CBS 122681]|uniref:P-loop containing nucleoside triphosphate hydrolase protein n=1 Tax=Lophiostoma macrostomum CBS 122681 TaxID=1314788 RepID=A0A6A6SU32_9PLEO|nr:hypothetical protein K491DRAFT_761961 [Lophiostoma macrostomum CBS 122681]
MSTILTEKEFETYVKEHKSLPRYDSTHEQRHPHPWWDVQKSNIDAGLKDLSMKVRHVIVEEPKDDVELRHVVRSAEGLCQIPRGKPIQVALTGSQGAGKSLLLNALFDCDGLSLTGADGQACTSAIIRYTRYGGHVGGSDARKYVAEVQFLKADKQGEMINEHARSYYHYQHAGDDSDDEEAPKYKTLGQDELDRRMKDTAEDVFHTLFGGDENFRAAWSPSSYRRGEFVRLCQVKCEEALSHINVDHDKKATFVGSDPKDLLPQIKRYMTKVEGETCLWPLVDSISIRFYDPLLEQNIEIVDLLGWGDINAARTRYADQIKDTVDVEMILGDTIRIATDDMVINNARSAAINHGMGHVKLVATKIDAISPNQLAQCTGPKFDDIKNRIELAENDAIEADEEDDAVKCDLLGKYKTYLERRLKQRKFRDQPALTPEETGIPGIRSYLFHLPAQQNFEEYKTHIFHTVPSFIDKVKRVVDHSDRDIGFRNLADDFDRIRTSFIPKFLLQGKTHFGKLSRSSMSKMRSDTKSYKDQMDDVVLGSWLQLKGPTFNKILKGRGSVLPGTSRAKGLEFGCDWNNELATVLTPGFKRWYNAQFEKMRAMEDALTYAFNIFCRDVYHMMNASASAFKDRPNGKKKTYVEPKVRYQKRRLRTHFTDGDQHFVERAMEEFHALIDNTISEVFEQHVADIDTRLEKFGEDLRNESPITYTITPAGQDMRTALEKLLPTLEEQATALRDWFPTEVKREVETQLQSSSAHGTSKEMDYLFEGIAKRKVPALTSSRTVKIKEEPGTKRAKLE